MGREINFKPIFYFREKDIPKGIKVLDIYEKSLHELFFIKHPHLSQYKANPDSIKNEISQFISDINSKGIWVYLPWRECIVHTVEEELYFLLRTARNKYIITEEEQKKYHDIKVGIIGLSIGSIILSSLVRSGGSKYIKLADDDVVEITNLNRMNASILDVNKNKAEVAAKNSWEIDPFLNLSVWNTRVTKENLEEFLLKDSKVDVFIDSMDSLELKIIARQICKKNKIPCLMATSNGESNIIDIERFDLNPNLPLFHGRLGEISAEDFKHGNTNQWLKKAVKIVDEKILEKRVKGSISEVGKTLSGVPQLSTTLQISGSMLSYAVRQIANNKELSSGRYTFSLNSHFTSLDIK